MHSTTEQVTSLARQRADSPLPSTDDASYGESFGDLQLRRSVFVAARGPRLLVRQLPQVLLATAVVAVLPTALVWWLQGTLIHSTIAAVLLATALSVVVSYVAEKFWRGRSSDRDLLFSELMVWGWARRWWSQRQLTNGRALFRGLSPAATLTPERRAQALMVLASALETCDPYTHGHSRRVARHATAIAQQMGLEQDQVAKIRLAALLHDVGKIQTPIPVLHKPGRLDDVEFDTIKQHPVDGAAMVAILDDADLTAMVLHHHERLDGRGYPDGLAGDEIPLGARIIAVADTFDAVTSTRPYRSGNPHRRAMKILAVEAGVQLDPQSVHAFERQYTGRRPFIIWLAVTNLPERIISLMGSGANVAVASTAKVIAMTAATGAVASATAVQLAPAKADAPARGGSTAIATTPTVPRHSSGGALDATTAQAAAAPSETTDTAHRRVQRHPQPKHAHKTTSRQSQLTTTGSSTTPVTGTPASATADTDATADQSPETPTTATTASAATTADTTAATPAAASTTTSTPAPVTTSTPASATSSTPAPVTTSTPAQTPVTAQTGVDATSPVSTTRSVPTPTGSRRTAPVVPAPKRTWPTRSSPTRVSPTTTSPVRSPTTATTTSSPVTTTSTTTSTPVASPPKHGSPVTTPSKTYPPAAGATNSSWPTTNPTKSSWPATTNQTTTPAATTTDITPASPSSPGKSPARFSSSFAPRTS